MDIKRVVKESFSVIGKERSTQDGEGFIQMLWQDANSHFDEVSKLAKRNENGDLIGIWGLMSDLSHSYRPWQNNFTEGSYLAGIECVDDAIAPNGWTKWTVPSFEYLCAEVKSNDTFNDVLRYMKENDIPLVGAVHDFTCPTTNKNYIYFPINIIEKEARS